MLGLPCGTWRRNKAAGLTHQNFRQPRNQFLRGSEIWEIVKGEKKCFEKKVLVFENMSTA